MTSSAATCDSPDSLLPIAHIADLPLIATGKVREIYDAGSGRLLLVTSERVSAFDVVFKETIPAKGQVLNLASAHWFEKTQHIVPNHMLETRTARILGDSPDAASHHGRLLLARRAEAVQFECVVRGHLDGSGWRDYQRTGAIAEHSLPAGMARYDRFPEPLFTPTTKAHTGHDESVTFDQMARALPDGLAERLRQVSLDLYNFGYREVATRGITLEDTKFEFGLIDGEIILIDEALTPDSSRYRMAQADAEPLALDKQYLRDALESHGYMGEGPPPPLPGEIVAELSRRYRQVFRLITGHTLDEALAQWG